MYIIYYHFVECSQSFRVVCNQLKILQPDNLHKALVPLVSDVLVQYEEEDFMTWLLSDT